MALVIPTDFAHVQHFFTGVAAPLGAAVTYGISEIGSPTPVSLATNLRDAMNTHIMPLLENSVTHSRVRVKMGPNETGPFGEVASSTAGSGTGPAATPQVAYLVEKITSLGGRRGRGRMYFPGVQETDVGEGGVLNAPTITAWNNALTAWLAAIIGFADIGTMFLLHAPGQSVLPAPTEVTSLQIDSTVATQRRRLR